MIGDIKQAKVIKNTQSPDNVKNLVGPRLENRVIPWFASFCHLSKLYSCEINDNDLRYGKCAIVPYDRSKPFPVIGKAGRPEMLALRGGNGC